MFGKIWLVAFLFLFLPVFALPVYGAIEVISYPVTEGLQVDTSKSTQNGQTFFTKNISINYESGKVLLSGSANGHDSLHVEDMIQVSKTRVQHLPMPHLTGCARRSTERYLHKILLISFLPDQITSILNFQTGVLRVSIQLDPYILCTKKLQSLFWISPGIMKVRA